jgi:hypothetical protein
METNSVKVFSHSHCCLQDSGHMTDNLEVWLQLAISGQRAFPELPRLETRLGDLASIQVDR